MLYEVITHVAIVDGVGEHADRLEVVAGDKAFTTSHPDKGLGRRLGERLGNGKFFTGRVGLLDLSYNFV